MDSDHSGGDEDLLIRVKAEPLYSIRETIIRLYISDASIKKYTAKQKNMSRMKISVLLKLRKRSRDEDFPRDFKRPRA